ncbi:hypothetical protein J7K43_07865 [Candidatus Calescamantes bacterium]|nr:hypothetical protein [Candidatus Calescamantes bacterium]
MERVPVILAEGKTLPEVWEKALIETWWHGVPFRTEYDRKEDPPSRDATVVMVIHEPFAEPRIHRAFPGGLEDLEVYTQEVVEGIHDNWIAPEEGKWSYTYHQRLFAYPSKNETINQIEKVIEKLICVPYTRRAQAITWNPFVDLESDDPPCLQRCGFRIYEEGEEKKLMLNTHWRSRDGYKAAFMNIFALTVFQKRIALEISKKLRENIKVGRYVDISDSFHIYGSYFKEFEGFLRSVERRSFAERTWETSFAEPIFEEARKRLKEEKDG